MEDDLSASFLVKIDFFYSLNRIWINTHFPKEIQIVKFHGLIRLRTCYVVNKKQKVKVINQEYLDDSNENINTVFPEDFVVFLSNI